MSETTLSDTPAPSPSSPDRRTERKWTDAPRRTVLILIAAFTIIELAGVIAGIPVQASLTAIAAFACINLAIFGYRTNRTAGVVMTAVFTTRLIALTLPATQISLPTRVGIVAVATIAISYVATWVLSWDVNSGRMDEGFLLRPPFISKRVTALLTALSGFPAGVLAYVILQPDELVVQPLFGTIAAAWTLAVIFLSFGALGEELVFRRLTAAMVQHTGRSQAPWPSAALYGAAFIGSQNPALIALAFACGALWSWSCERTGTIEPVVAAHIITTILTFVALPAIF
jgi:membrane protease YdiL (CAAX protease family)